MVQMLYNHACIGIWSVFKEPKVYFLPNRPNNYGRLCQIMWEAAATVDPIRWVHKGDYDEGVKNVMVGYVMPGDVDIKKMKIEAQHRRVRVRRYSRPGDRQEIHPGGQAMAARLGRMGV